MTDEKRDPGPAEREITRMTITGPVTMMTGAVIEDALVGGNTVEDLIFRRAFGRPDSASTHGGLDADSHLADDLLEAVESLTRGFDRRLEDINRVLHEIKAAPVGSAEPAGLPGPSGRPDLLNAAAPA
jgi:hypothetical protein